jgi:hypothetical protein
MELLLSTRCGNRVRNILIVDIDIELTKRVRARILSTTGGSVVQVALLIWRNTDGRDGELIGGVQAA